MQLFDEAYVTRSKGSVILEPLPQRLRPKLMKKYPPKQDSDAIWIPGYWSWSGRYKDFIWISGVWRVPPPEHIWIKGFWNLLEAGWVWVPGFWSDVNDSSLSFISTPPPDPIDENVDGPPSSNYFWMPGHWAFSKEDTSTNGFQVSGNQLIPTGVRPCLLFVETCRIYLHSGRLGLASGKEWKSFCLSLYCPGGSSKSCF